MIKKLRRVPLIYQIRRDLARYFQLVGLMRNIHLPNPLFPDDVFVVSYPKSGNTWLRFILAHIQYPEAEIDFHTISNYVPAGAGWADRVRRKRGKPQLRPRFIKTHVRYQPKFPRVIYLVRDGRDVYVSYYKFLRDRLPPEIALVDFIKKKDLPYGTWSQNIMSWLDADLPQDRFLLIKYGTMLEDPLAVMQRIAAFCNVDWSKKRIQRAIAQSSFENMRKIEENKGLPEQNVFSGKFVREGKTANWKRHFGKPERQVFKKHHNAVLLRLGYEKNADWE
jgi:estrone sulfotransferase